MRTKVMRIAFFAFLAFMMLMSSALVAGTAGKIRGKVVDKQTGEPLIGASIRIDGTSLGAASDVNGQYYILNVQSGTYVLKAGYIGYQSMQVSNVEVNGDLTTEINFPMSSEAVSMGVVQIVAETPLVNKKTTNTVAIFKSDQIENMPVRGVAAVVALAGGVVSQGGNLYVRGGRSDEVAYYVDGVLVTNPINMQSSLNVISNSIEEVSSQIGGMTAEYGNAMSGVVNTTSKIGGTRYNANVEVITDGFLSATTNKYGAYSYGLNEYVVSLGGPVLPNDNRIRFYVTGQRVFNRSAISALDGVHYPIYFDSTKILSADYVVVNRDSGIVTGLTPGSTPRRSMLANLLNSANLDGGRNFGGLDRDSWALNGNVFFDFNQFNVKVGGMYNSSLNFSSLGKGLTAINIAANAYRPVRTEAVDGSAFAKFTHVIDPATYYTVNLNYFITKQEAGDSRLWRDYEAYGDPSNPANPQLIGPSRQPSNATIYSFSIPNPGNIQAVTGGIYYQKISRANYGTKVDFVHQFGSTWEFKAGGEYTYYTVRTYNNPALGFAQERLNKPTASDWTVYNDVGVDFYGYDIYGNEFDGGKFTDKTGYTVNLSKEGPRHPVFGGAYLQNKIEMSDLIINAGVRLDYIDPGGKRYKNPRDIGIVDIDGTYVVADSSMIQQDRSAFLSPRLGFAFPVSDKTVFHAEYGRFVQQGRLSDVYDTRISAAYYLNGGYARQFPNPNLKPEKTTDYQIGIRQQLGSVSAFDATFFYKDTRDLHVVRVFFPDPGAPHNSYITVANGDFGTIKGFTFRFDVRRTNRVALSANYTLQNAVATGSVSGSHFDIAWQDNSFQGQPYFPVTPSPTDFDRTHSGVVSLDYRFAENDGPTLFNSKPFQKVGLNLLFSFSSGRRYTEQQVNGAFSFSSVNAPQPYENLNVSSAPWTSTLDLKLDKTLTFFGGTDLNVYLWVQNVLNTKNIVNIYPATGQPNNDGWFSTAQGKSWEETNGPDARKLYDYLVDNNTYYGNPRVIRLGAKLSL